MTEDFNKWWNADQGYDGVTNPYRSDSAVYWAWEGWQAAMKAEREACAALADKWHDYCAWEGRVVGLNIAKDIRARGEQ